MPLIVMAGAVPRYAPAGAEAPAATLSARAAGGITPVAPAGGSERDDPIARQWRGLLIRAVPVSARRPPTAATGWGWWEGWDVAVGERLARVGGECVWGSSRAMIGSRLSLVYLALTGPPRNHHAPLPSSSRGRLRGCPSSSQGGEWTPGPGMNGKAAEGSCLA